MVEVFKTNVQKKMQSKMLQSSLSKTFPKLKINFDLSDPDKILRVEGNIILPEQIIEATKSKGYHCEILN